MSKLKSFSPYRKHPCYAVNQSWENNDGKSEVIPDQTLSMRQLIQRHMSSGTKMSYGEDIMDKTSRVIPPGFENMSKIDRHILLESLPSFIATTRGEIISRREANRRASLLAQGSHLLDNQPESQGTEQAGRQATSQGG